METAVGRLVPIPEVRQVLGGIGHTTVYELIKQREITKVNIGRRGLTSESLEAYMDRLAAASGGNDAGSTMSGITSNENCPSRMLTLPTTTTAAFFGVSSAMLLEHRDQCTGVGDATK
jgi:predicted DNA-binding transcriptional regulator AlpA